MRVNTSSVTGYPQIHMLDPDRNVIEINAESDERSKKLEVEVRSKK